MDRVEEVYRRVHPRLWRALLAYSGDADVASDSEAEAFAQAIRRGDAIDDVERWVWTSSFRIAAGMLARRRAPHDADSADRVEVPASTAEFLSMLGALSEQQRACVVLRYVGQLTPTEIAGVLDTSPGTVRVQLHRAHESLRSSLSEEHASGGGT